MILRLVNNTEESTSLHINSFVQQRIEEIVYKSSISNSSIPISYLLMNDISANTNLATIDKSGWLPANLIEHQNKANDFFTIAGNSFSTDYPDLWITNKSVNDASGNIIPLFYAHELLPNTTTIRIEKVTNTKNEILLNGFLLDESLSKVCFNFTNKFNFVNGNYELYFITATTSDNITIKGLINPVSVIREATWEDIDIETGELNPDFIFFNKETNASDFTFYFSQSDTFFIKPKDIAYIKPLELALQQSISGWFPRFSSGQFKFTSNVDNVTRLYSVPEYENLSFFPSRPYFFDSNADIKFINSNIFFLGRKNTATNDSNRPLEIIIYDKNDNVIYALTTKETKNNTKYLNDTLWSTEKIASWDNENGIVEITIPFQDSFTYHVTYYYEVKEINYYHTNLNPIYNELVYTHFYVYYLKPDVSDRAIHHLVVRTDGIIVDCSDEEFRPLVDDVYNSSTFFGLNYRNSLNSYQNDDWVSLYSVEGVNSYQYLILSEVFFVEKQSPNLIESVDVQRLGNSLNKTNYWESIYRNSKLFHTEYAATTYGFEYPQNNSLVIRCSLTLLEDYGGIFTIDTLKAAFTKYLASGKYILFEWDEKIEEITIDNSQEGSITFSWRGLGVGYCYDVYRSTVFENGYEYIDTICSNYSLISYTDSTVESGSVYYYYLIPVLDDIKFIQSVIVGSEAR